MYTFGGVGTFSRDFLNQTLAMARFELALLVVAVVIQLVYREVYKSFTVPAAKREVRLGHCVT